MLRKDIEMLDGLPVLFIRPLSALVCTDLHLGYEGVMADNGTFLPKINLKNAKLILSKAAKETLPECLIVDGDIKNEFSKVHAEEFNEFGEFMRFVKEDLGIDRVILVKGNHDNFIDRLKSALGFEVYTQEALLGDFLFFHGEELPKEKGGKVLVMGHVHPAISIYNSLGLREKVRCFLYGKMKDRREIVVLPAMNYFAEGVGVNSGEGLGRMAPVFKKMLELDRMETFGIGEGETLRFGKVEGLKRLYFK